MWASSGLKAINLFDEAALEQDAKTVIGINAANLLNPRLRHRLPIGNHGERLQWCCGHIGTASADPCQHGARLLWATRQLQLIAVRQQGDAAAGEALLQFGY